MITTLKIEDMRVDEAPLLSVEYDAANNALRVEVEVTSIGVIVRTTRENGDFVVEYLG